MNPTPLLSHVTAIRDRHLEATSIHCCCCFNYPLKSDGMGTRTIKGDFCCKPHSLAVWPYWRHYSCFQASSPSYSFISQITYPWKYHVTFRLAMIWARNCIINSVLRLVRGRSQLIKLNDVQQCLLPAVFAHHHVAIWASLKNEGLEINSWSEDYSTVRGVLISTGT